MSNTQGLSQPGLDRINNLDLTSAINGNTVTQQIVTTIYRSNANQY